MSNHQLHNSRAIRSADDPSIFGAHHLGVVGDHRSSLNFCVPSLEQVEQEHSVSLNPTDAPSFKAAQRMSEDFKRI